MYVEPELIRPLAQRLYHADARFADPNNLLTLFTALHLKPSYSLGLAAEAVYNGQIGRAYAENGNRRFYLYEKPDVLKWKDEPETFSFDAFIVQKSEWGYFQLVWFMEEVRLLSLFWHAGYLLTLLVYSVEDFKELCRSSDQLFPNFPIRKTVDPKPRKQIPADKQGLHDTLMEMRKECESFWERLAELDLRPSVVREGKEWKIRAYRFSPWGGVFAADYVVDEDIHKITREILTKPELRRVDDPFSFLKPESERTFKYVKDVDYVAQFYCSFIY